MNRGTLNGYALNAKGARGTVFRLAADLIGQAYLVARARVLRHLTGPMTAEAVVGPVPGRRAVREAISAVAEAVSTVTAFPRLRGVFEASCEAAATVAASVGRRALAALQAQAQIDLTAYALLCGAAVFEVRADTPDALTVWKLSPTAFTGAAVVALSAGIDNEFPYDEDAPEERVFVVAPEDNIFYVVV